jgi:hypothetical protein
VVLAYSWRSMVCSMGKEHGQNRGPTMTVLVILPIEWSVCAQDHTSLARREC